VREVRVPDLINFNPRAYVRHDLRLFYIITNFEFISIHVPT